MANNPPPTQQDESYTILPTCGECGQMIAYPCVFQDELDACPFFEDMLSNALKANPIDMSNSDDDE